MSISFARMSATGILAIVLGAWLASGVGVAQAIHLTRGQRVREIVTTPDSGPKRVGMAVTVVAVPGDRVGVENGRLFVNDRPVEGFSADLVAMVAGSKRLPKQMPEGQHLVMGEYSVLGGDVVRKWGMYSASALEPVLGEPGR
jgi:hypothetical protein